MKKTFQLTHAKIKYPRLVEGVKRDVRKYIKRERRKELPEGVDFWDFDCKFGDTEESAKVIHLSELEKCITDAGARELESFYIEILATQGVRTKKPRPGEEPPPAPPRPEVPKVKTFGQD